MSNRLVGFSKGLILSCSLLLTISCAQEQETYITPPTESCEKKVIDNEFIIAHFNGSLEKSSQRPQNTKTVKWYEPNYRVNSPPLIHSEWSYLLPEKKNLVLWNRLGITELWKKDIKGQNIRVGVVDTGVNINSPFLKGQIPPITPANDSSDEIGSESINGENNVVGWNVIDNSSLQNDESLHGTIIAQLIAGLADSPMGPGVAPEVQIIPVDFMDENGGNELDAIAAIEYTIRHGAKIINNSWSTPCSKSLREKYPEWEAKGVLLVHAAGNKGIDLAELPESSSNYKGRGFLTVGSTDDADRRASFSNFGKSVDIFTQGTNITTIDQGYFEEGIETQLIEVSGTSYSTAIVSGLAALVWSKHPEWSNYQVKSALIGLTSQDESSPGIPYIDPNKLETFAN